MVIDVGKLREILRHWGVYGPSDPDGHMFEWKAFPIDDLSDEAILELARMVAGTAEEEAK